MSHTNNNPNFDPNLNGMIRWVVIAWIIGIVASLAMWFTLG